MQTTEIKIGNRIIGTNRPSFIIAEVGINHNGELKIAKDHIDAAKASGADCVKFQTFRAEEFMADKELVYEYQSQGKLVKEKMYDMFKRLELPIEWHRELFDYTEKQGMVPMTSVADPISVDLVEALDPPAFKLSSEDLINLPLVEYTIQKKRPIIFSTGMAEQDEVEDVVALLKKYNFHQAIFLHCVSVYPTPENEANLQRMQSLAALLPYPVGYSDHTMGSKASEAAVAMGATVIEKHFTLDRNLPGPDHAFSSNPAELREMVDAIRQIERMKGDPKIYPSKTELLTRLNFRRSIVAVKGLKAGHVIKHEDLHLKRPGHGLRAKEMPMLINRSLKRNINKDEMITLRDLE